MINVKVDDILVRQTDYGCRLTEDEETIYMTRDELGRVLAVLTAIHQTLEAQLGREVETDD